MRSVSQFYLQLIFSSKSLGDLFEWANTGCIWFTPRMTAASLQVSLAPSQPALCLCLPEQFCGSKWPRSVTRHKVDRIMETTHFQGGGGISRPFYSKTLCSWNKHNTKRQTLYDPLICILRGIKFINPEKFVAVGDWRLELVFIRYGVSVLQD